MLKNLNDDFNDDDEFEIKEQMDVGIEFQDVSIDDEMDDDFEEKMELYEVDIENGVEEKESINNSINYDESESELDVYFKYGTNNHKLDGKHSLKRDTILNGKLTDVTLEDDSQSYTMEFDQYDTSDTPIERGSMFEEDSKHSEDVQVKKKLSEDVYYLLKNNTELDFSSNRRKPNKITFNNYYKMLLNNIDHQYTKSEIFVELAYYFTDNIFNMFKLLDKKYATIIIKELREKGFLNNMDIDFT